MICSVLCATGVRFYAHFEILSHLASVSPEVPGQISRPRKNLSAKLARVSVTSTFARRRCIPGAWVLMQSGVSDGRRTACASVLGVQQPGVVCQVRKRPSTYRGSAVRESVQKMVVLILQKMVLKRVRRPGYCSCSKRRQEAFSVAQMAVRTVMGRVRVAERVQKSRANPSVATATATASVKRF